MSAARDAALTSIRLLGVLLMLAALAGGLVAPQRVGAAGPFSPGAKVVTTDTVNVRTKADTSAPVRAVAEEGAFFTIGQIRPRQADGYTWYRVSTFNRVNYGWIADDFLALDDTLSEVSCARVVDGPVNLRSSAGTNKSIVTTLPTGTGLRVLESDPVTANGYLWYRVSTSDATGWVASQFVASDNCGSTDQPVIAVGVNVRVVDGPLNVREDADTSADIVRVLETNSIGWIIDGPVRADGYTWWEFRNLGGLPGWVVEDFIVADPDAVICDGMAPCSSLDEGDMFVVTTDALNVRRSPDLQSAVVDVAAFGAVGTVIGADFDFADDRYWVNVSIPSVGSGWVALEFVEET